MVLCSSLKRNLSLGPSQKKNEDDVSCTPHVSGVALHTLPLERHSCKDDSNLNLNQDKLANVDLLNVRLSNPKHKCQDLPVREENGRS